ncbi:MAG: methionyl-tRNA formyltransferase [Pseudomonadota bacterium]
MRLVFMGTPDFAVPTLEALVEAGHGVAAVYTQPPRPAGRGKKPRPGPVQAQAEALGLEVRHPTSLKSEAEQAAFAALEADAAVVAAYGLILPRAVLEAPRLGCWNVHASLLPRWRGAAPIQRALLAGDAETGVCIMRMEAGLDTGPVVLREATEIGPEDTGGSLHDRLAEIGARLMPRALAGIAQGTLEAEVQPDEGVTYAAKIEKAEARVDWARPAAEVDRRIRAFAPFPGAWTEIGGERVKLLLSRVEAGDGAPGEALDDRLLVACGEGAMRVLRLQRAGKGAAEAEDVLRGFGVPAGMRLGG